MILILNSFYKKESINFSYELKTFLKDLDFDSEILERDELKNILKDKIDFFKNIDFIIIPGGDGSILSLSRLLYKYNGLDIPVFSINFGEIGFILEIDKKNYKEQLKYYLFNKEKVSLIERTLLIANLKGYDVDISCLNEFVLNSMTTKLIKFNIYINKEKFLTYKADGIIISTPTGSTAYNMSAGGAIVDNELDAIILRPLCPYLVSDKSIILKDTNKISIEISKDNLKSYLISDGQKEIHLKDDNIIEFKKCTKKLKMIKGAKSFYFKIKNKLYF